MRRFSKYNVLAKKNSKHRLHDKFNDKSCAEILVTDKYDEIYNFSLRHYRESSSAQNHIDPMEL